MTIDVVATGRDGQPVRDLSAADFEVLENRRPRPIAAFQFIDLEAVKPMPPQGVFTNTADQGALFVLVMDEMKLDTQHTVAARRWAERFIDDHLKPNDYVAVVRSGADTGLLLSLNRDYAKSVIHQALGQRARSVTTGLVTAAEANELGLSDNAPIESGRQTTNSLESLEQAVSYLARIPARRKAVLWFSPGAGVPIDLIGDPARDDGGRVTFALQRLLHSARVANVAVYGIDGRGLFPTPRLTTMPNAKAFVTSPATGATGPSPTRTVLRPGSIASRARTGPTT